MARILFFRMVFRKFSELLKTNQFLVSAIFFPIMDIFFFQSAFWSLFNHRQRSESNREQCSMCCGSPCFLVLLCTHYGSLQCFSTYFLKLKEIGVLRSIFADYFISCDYDKINPKCYWYILKSFLNNKKNSVYTSFNS